jgi:hypothetical protein
MTIGSTCSLAAFTTAAVPFRWSDRIPSAYLQVSLRGTALARAALVRALIIAASRSAIAARMYSVNRVAVGSSTATNSTPLSLRFAKKGDARQAIAACDD